MSSPQPTAAAVRSVALFGECMVELHGRAFGAMTQTFGGDTLNAAVYLARCAAPGSLQVSYATALGDDVFSRGMQQRWQAEGLDLGLVRRLPGRLPGLYTIEVDERGERSFSYWREQSAARDYFATPIGVRTPLEEAAPGLAALMVSGISLAILDEPGRERLFGVMRAVRSGGGRVVFDNNYRPRLWLDAAAARAAFDAALALADIALLTLDDEAALRGDGGDTDALLRRTLALPCDEVVVKRGAESTWLRAGGAAPVERVPKVVDSTAAGDAFAGAYLAARLGGHGALAAVHAGQRVAACVVQHAGAIVPREAMAGLLAGQAAGGLPSSGE